MKIIKLLKGLLQHVSTKQPALEHNTQPVIIPRSLHTISRQAISRNALTVLYRLHHAGFSAYLVGGCVRDLLLGHRPKDFDIATNAHPEEIRKLFKNCRLIGKRFRLAHILFGREIIEVATFRTHHENAEEHHARMHKGMIVRDNVFGEIEDDVWRRDFTINALYYNIADFSVVDYTGAMQDIQLRLLRMIGEPEKRFREDPVRLLRAIRIMGKLKLNISPETEVSIVQLSHLLQHVSSARLYQEVLKFFEEGNLLSTFYLLKKYKLFNQLFPQTEQELQRPDALKLIELSLSNTEHRLQAGKTVSPAFLFAVFLWSAIQQEAKHQEANKIPTYVAFEKAIRHILQEQTKQLAIPRYLQIAIRDICFLQHRFTMRHGARPYRVLEHPRLRAALDLLMLRKEAGESVHELYEWWMTFYAADFAQREQLIKQMHQSFSKNKKRRSRKMIRAT